MGDISARVLAIRTLAEAAEGGEEAGGNNFLVPNGTFFAILGIFLVVLGVISIFVVPPIMKVLRERENMVTKTLSDNKQSAEQFAAADADYEGKMSVARVEASTVRDDARAEGRKVLEDMRSRAEAEVASTLQRANEQLKSEGDVLAEELRARVETLSTTLASRVLGIDLANTVASTTAAGR
ncbi:MAG TPA: F0F1 ATP synthase subunit B [Mycobacterium sp.]|nr:F0F1 ATP synthase subunit B [Mycobacterium sp.]